MRKGLKKVPVLAWISVLLIASCHIGGDRKVQFWQENSVTTFRFTYDSEVQYDLSNVFQGSAVSTGKAGKLHSFAGGDLLLSDLGNQDSLHVLRADFRELVVRVESEGRNAEAEAQQISQGLSIPFYLLMSDTGSINGILVAPEVPPKVLQYAVSILSHFQTIASQNAKGSHWETLEDDQYGRCLTSYSKSDTVGIPLWFKEKKYYLNTKKENTFLQRQYIPKSRSKIEYNKSSGLCQSLIQTEQVLVLINGKPSGQAQTQMSAQHVSTAPMSTSEKTSRPASFQKAKATSKVLSLFEAASEGNNNLAMASQTLGSDSLSSILSRFFLLEKKNKKEDVSIFLKMRALLTIHPQTADTLVAMVLTAPYASFRMRIIGDALAYSGTPAAQHALLHLVEHRIKTGFEPNVAVQLFTKVAQPIPEIIIFLKSMISNPTTEPILWQNAVLTLGTTSWKTIHSNPLQSKASVLFLMERLEQINNPDVKYELILALGNSGNPSMKPLLDRWIEAPDKSPQLKAAAVWALRLLAGTDIDRQLLNLLESQSVHVSNAAFNTIDARPALESNLEYLILFFFKEIDLNTRTKIFHSIMNMDAYYPDTITHFLQQAASDPERSIQKLASDQLKAR